VDPDPAVGRARLVCFSFGGPQGSAPSSPITVATVEGVGLKPGRAALTLENVAFFAPDGKAIDVAAERTTIVVK
jgi:hypothetical protein